MSKRMLKLAALMVPAILSVGCATQPTKSYDYSAFEASNPRSILVLPPLNNSPDVTATFGVYGQVTPPLAEAGYYVLPVGVVNETFKQNGLTSANDIHNVDPKKLQQIFGADAALYMTITQYGSTYKVVTSVTTVAAEAKLVDLRTGALLWENKVLVTDGGSGGNTGGDPMAILVQAAVSQILNSKLDMGYRVARLANERLLAGGLVNGLLYGPRSRNYKGRDASLPRATLATGPMPAVSLAPAVALGSTPIVRAQAVSNTSTAPVAVPVTEPVAAPMPVRVAAPMPVAVATPAAVRVVTPVAVRVVTPVAVAVVAPVAVPVAAPMPVAVATAPVMYTAPATIVNDVLPEPEVAAPPAQLSGPEQRYADVLRAAQAQHQALDPASNWYRSDLYEWVMERKAEFIGAGLAPDVALQRAIALMKGN